MYENGKFGFFVTTSLFMILVKVGVKIVLPKLEAKISFFELAEKQFHEGKKVSKCGFDGKAISRIFFELFSKSWRNK